MHIGFEFSSGWVKCRMVFSIVLAISKALYEYIMQTFPTSSTLTPSPYTVWKYYEISEYLVTVGVVFFLSFENFQVLKQLQNFQWRVNL
jgi:hypothetical protein